MSLIRIDLVSCMWNICIVFKTLLKISPFSVQGVSLHFHKATLLPLILLRHTIFTTENYFVPGFILFLNDNVHINSLLLPFYILKIYLFISLEYFWRLFYVETSNIILIHLHRTRRKIAPFTPFYNFNLLKWFRIFRLSYE